MSPDSAGQQRSRREVGGGSFASDPSRPLRAQTAEQAARQARVFARLPFVMLYRRLEDDNWTLDSVDRGSRGFIGFEPEDLSKGPVSYMELIHPEDRQRVREVLRADLDAHGAFEVAYRLRTISGGERTVVDRGYRVSRSPEPPLVEGFVTQRDIGIEPGRPKNDDELMLRVLVEQSLAGIYLIRDNRFAYVNPRLAEIFGYQSREILDLPSVLDLVHADDRTLVAQNLRRRREGGVDEIRYEFRGLTKRGSVVEVEVHGSRIDVEGTPCVFGVVLDISHRRLAEELGPNSEKLDALRRLASGVAHDLNNFLSTIRTTAEVLGLERAGDAELIRDVTEIIQAVQRGATLSRQLAGFGRVHDTQDAVAAPSEVLLDLAAHLDPLLGRRIDLQTDIAPNLPMVPVGPESLRDAIMNLVLNAQDAMPAGGVLTIRAQRLPPRQVVIEVADTGGGIHPEAKEHLFEPHFTTKGERGTGLGLPNVQRVVYDACGAIEVDSAPGHGSIFRILLPSGQAI